MQNEELSYLFDPLKTIQFVPRDSLKPNDYNPNKVMAENLKLLTQSILANGWTMPIVVRPDMTIIDGFHRWTVAGMEPLKSRLGGLVPVVIVHHKTETEDIFGTITHNRARGIHVLEPMEKIVQKLLAEGKTVAELGKELGMRPEEIYRLSGWDRKQFLKYAMQGQEEYSKASVIKRV
jgi:ParB-like chromosome segregation protein Spo0J